MPFSWLPKHRHADRRRERPKRSRPKKQRNRHHRPPRHSPIRKFVARRVALGFLSRRLRIDCYIHSPSALARTRSKRRPRGERARAHAEARAERRRHVAQHVTAARAAAVINDRAGSVGAQPVAAQIALGIDALNGEPGQILHNLFPSEAFSGHPTAKKTLFPPKARRWRELWPG
jgi:hypothetical protein